MAHEYKAQLARLKQILLALRPSGEDGFEGVVAEALSRISDVPFRLAKGGTQSGKDGAAAYAEDAICFECKRYDSEPPASEVVIKIEDLCRHKDEADLLWALACTASISTQLAERLRDKAAKDRVEILILDWTGDPPPLAIVLAKAGSPVIDKIVALSERVAKNELEEIFVAIREQEGFEVQADKLLRRPRSALRRKTGSGSPTGSRIHVWPAQTSVSLLRRMPPKCRTGSGTISSLA